MAFEVVINHASCEGHGLCEMTAPQIYGLDDDGQVVLKQEPGEDPSAQAAAEAGARVCPVAALSIRK